MEQNVSPENTKTNTGIFYLGVVIFVVSCSAIILTGKTYLYFVVGMGIGMIIHKGE